jgi:hypothetical protein
MINPEEKEEPDYDEIYLDEIPEMPIRDFSGG